jgi:SOS-response transcriptional repressor LexA
MTVSTIPRRPTPAGIKDGGHMILRRRQLAGSGEIVVAMLKAEATVKRPKTVRDLIQLRPENRHLTVGPEADLRIVGNVIAGCRRAGRYAV